MLNVMLVEDKNHSVEVDQEECRNKWQAVFPVVKLVAPSCVLWLHRKQQTGVTEFIIEKTLVTSAH